MKGNSEILETLKKLLVAELTAMDVYFVQSRMCADWGFTKIHDRLAHEFDDEKRHAQALIERILFLDGLPDMGARLPFEVGDNVEAMFRGDLDLECQVGKNLNAAIAQAEALGDNGTRSMLAPLLVDTEEDHIFFLESQLGIIETIGLERYLAEQL